MWTFIERLWSARISLYPPDEARLRSLNLTLAIAGRAIGSLQVGAADAGREPLLRTRLGQGFHRYELRGTAHWADQHEPLAIGGSGLIVDRQRLSRRIAASPSGPRPGDALRTLLDELRQAAGAIEELHLPCISAEQNWMPRRRGWGFPFLTAIASCWPGLGPSSFSLPTARYSRPCIRLKTFCQ